MESKFHLVSNLIQYLSLIILSPAFESANNSANDTVGHDDVRVFIAIVCKTRRNFIPSRDSPDRLRIPLCGHFCRAATEISFRPKNRPAAVRICDVTGGKGGGCSLSLESSIVSRSIDHNLFIIVEIRQNAACVRACQRVVDFFSKSLRFYDKRKLRRRLTISTFDLSAV